VLSVYMTCEQIKFKAVNIIMQLCIECNCFSTYLIFCCVTVHWCFHCIIFYFNNVYLEYNFDIFACLFNDGFSSIRLI
jgi:hypothetical protein